MAGNKKHVIAAALGKEPADLVLKNASYVNVFTKKLMTGDIAVTDGMIVGISEQYQGRTELDMCAHGNFFPAFLTY